MVRGASFGQVLVCFVIPTSKMRKMSRNCCMFYSKNKDE